MQNGKVYLVGAGPGDAGLLTVKGSRLLEKADVIVYDSLIGTAILAQLPEDAEKINVGKRASNHVMPQEEINRLLLDRAQSGLTVVRLKGGDPFLFGRGGEELELLAKHHIPYEVVPGVTSSIAVPAYNGIPVTHRDFASSVHIITGHRKAGCGTGLDFDTLVRLEGTLVFLMGLRSMPEICRGLLNAGMDPEMPAAVLERGTTARQRRVVSTIRDLPADAENAGIAAPAVVLIGRVCSLAERFAWYEKLPLAGCRILLTRPRDMISAMSERLRGKGAEVIELPAVRLNPVPDNQRLTDALKRIGTYQWLAFTSPSGVRIFMNELRKRRIDRRMLSGIRIAALGNGTARELEKSGLYPDVVPEKYEGRALGKAIASAAAPEDRILMPRARIGNKEILEELSSFYVDDIPLYDTQPESGCVVDLAGMFAQGEIDFAVFTSSSSVRAFLALAPGLNPSDVVAACIGTKTAAAAKRAGMRTLTADEATMDSLTELVIRSFSERKGYL